MSQAQTDLFNEPHIQIEGNALLERICNHILDLVGRDSSLLNGDKVGMINRKVTLAVYFDSGLLPIIKSGDVDKFKEWFMSKENCPTEEEIARAIRYLASKDYIRLPQKAVQAAEQDRMRIARSVK